MIRTNGIIQWLNVLLKGIEYCSVEQEGRGYEYPCVCMRWTCSLLGICEDWYDVSEVWLSGVVCWVYVKMGIMYHRCNCWVQSAGYMWRWVWCVSGVIAGCSLLGLCEDYGLQVWLLGVAVWTSPSWRLAVPTTSTRQRGTAGPLFVVWPWTYVLPPCFLSLGIICIEKSYLKAMLLSSGWVWC